MDYMAYYESTSVHMDVHLKPHIVDSAHAGARLRERGGESHRLYKWAVGSLAAQWSNGFVAAGHDWSRSHQGGSSFQREGEDVVLMQQ